MMYTHKINKAKQKTAIFAEISEKNDMKDQRSKIQKKLSTQNKDRNSHKVSDKDERTCYGDDFTDIKFEDIDDVIKYKNTPNEGKYREPLFLFLKTKQITIKNVRTIARNCR